MNRRRFLGTAVSASAAAPLLAAATTAPSDEILTTKPDGLNPVGIRTAGIRMVPVVAGKYKVWTKKIGSGRTKVLLLHGGPGASHECRVKASLS